MAFTFLAAQGMGVGRSLLDESLIDTVRNILEQAKALGVDILLPVDVVVAPEISGDAPTQVVDSSAIPDDWMGLDIGPETAKIFADAVSQAATVVWNGPMGVFEIPAFAHGTLRLAQALADSSAFTVVGGGDSAAAIRVLGVEETAFNHISTGGGASLELLEGRVLPGLAILEEDQ
jgi:phosphoglycerate kinase